MKRFFLSLLVFQFMFYGCLSSTHNINVYKDEQVDYVKQAYQSVGTLSISTKDGSGGVSATGFAVDKNHLVSAAHFCLTVVALQVFEEGGDVKIQYYDKDFEVKEKVAYIDKISTKEDVCILKSEDHGLPPLPIVDDYSKVSVRDEVAVVGSPLGLIVGDFSGKVISPSFDHSPVPILKGKLVLSVPATGGISGSPIILVETGEVIGVLVMGVPSFHDLSFAVNGNALKEFLGK